jgi:hypothetical protein
MWHSDWYTVGLFVGFGVALGVAAAGLLGGGARSRVVAALVGAGAAVALSFAFYEWDEAVGGAVGGVAGALGAAPIVAGTLRRGGTRLGTAVLVAVAAIAVAGLAFVPAIGYLEALAVPALAARLRRRSPERYAGLRTLAKD